MIERALAYFSAAAEHGSIHEAAKALRVAQSAISRQIQKLEMRYGMALLERHARGIKLTAAGELMLHHAHDSMQASKRLGAEFDALHGLRHGRVQLHTIESLVQDFLPQAITRFRARHPGISFDVTVEGTDQIVLALREGRTDIGIAFSPPRSSELITLFKVREPMVVLMRVGHPLARRRTVALAEALQFPVAVPARNSGSRLLVDAACKAARLNLAPVLETNSVQFLVRLVRESDTVTFLPRLSAVQSLHAGELVAGAIRDARLAAATIEALAPAQRDAPPAVREFQRFLIGEFQLLRVAH